VTTNALEFDDVTLSYGSATAVFGFSLSVAEGETVGLLGRNGAGKTTTLRGVIGSEVRRTGAVRLFGTDITGRSPDAIVRAGVGWVPDDRRIYPTLTVRENLMLGARVRGAAARSALDDAVGFVPLVEKLIDRRGVQLSGGEQQAVAIARALVARPRVLLLDEPTEGLAPIVVAELKQSVQRLQQAGMSVVIAEQNLGFVLDIAQRVYVLDSGRPALTCTAEHFRNSPELQSEHLAIHAEAYGRRR
jgi:branched-chain amino acid transport system ATP-binding protein